MSIYFVSYVFATVIFYNKHFRWLGSASHHHVWIILLLWNSFPGVRYCRLEQQFTVITLLVIWASSSCWLCFAFVWGEERQALCTWVWESEDSSWELVLLPLCRFWWLNSVRKHGGKHLSPLSHLAGPLGRQCLSVTLPWLMLTLEPLCNPPAPASCMLGLEPSERYPICLPLTCIQGLPLVVFNYFEIYFCFLYVWVFCQNGTGFKN